MSKMIYVAGPIFSSFERKFLEDLIDTLSKELKLDAKDDFFLSHRDVGDVGLGGVGRDKAFFDDLQALDESRIIVAWLDGPDVDSGTAVELGYAYAKGDKKIFGLLTDRRRWDQSLEGVSVNNMIWGVCKKKGDIHRTIEGLIGDLVKVLEISN
jgi:nucleoside 2-deoxyribosyltransferase